MSVLERVLVIDDEPLVRMLLVDILLDGGCQAEEADTFREALAKLDAGGEALTAAIVDLSLPDRSGIDIVDEIRRQRPQLPIVVATGRAIEDLREHFAQDALVRVLQKPFERPQVIASLRSVGVRWEEGE